MAIPTPFGRCRATFYRASVGLTEPFGRITRYSDIGLESLRRRCCWPKVVIWETSLPRDQPTVHIRSFDPLSEQHWPYKGCAGTRELEIFGLQSGMPGNPGQDSAAQFGIIVKRNS